MSTDGRHTKWRRKIAENVNRLSRVHERCRRQTDGRAHYSEREPLLKLKNNMNGASHQKRTTCDVHKPLKPWLHVQFIACSKLHAIIACNKLHM